MPWNSCPRSPGTATHDHRNTQTIQRMGHPARPLHDPGNHRLHERQSHGQPARRGRLTRRLKPPRSTSPTPRLGARSKDPTGGVIGVQSPPVGEWGTRWLLASPGPGWPCWRWSRWRTFVAGIWCRQDAPGDACWRSAGVGACVGATTTSAKKRSKSMDGGAPGEIRTPTPSQASDFESPASTVPPQGHAPRGAHTGSLNRLGVAGKPPAAKHPPSLHEGHRAPAGSHQPLDHH